MNKNYQKPEFYIVCAHTDDILTASGDLFADVNGFSIGGGGVSATSSWGGTGSSGSTGVEL